jgi:GMP synthase-like glutamine amidotransferase
MVESIPGLPDHSVLYVSSTIHPDHPLHSVFRKEIDRKPDLDLGRLIESAGPWVRRYFAERVIDGTCEPVPTDLSIYRGLVIGCSMHYVSRERGGIALWQKNLIDLVRRAVFDYELPFLGLCGGGQIGLVAFGGQVRPNPVGVGLNPDHGGGIVFRTTTVELTEEGRSDPLFRGCPQSFGMQAIHSDYLAEYPEGFKVLANSADIPNQVLALGDKVRLFGVHPEMSAEFVQRVGPAFLNSNEVSLAYMQYGTEVLLERTKTIAPTPEANKLVVHNFLTEFCAKR